jgi:hypothetical protein
MDLAKIFSDASNVLRLRKRAMTHAMDAPLKNGLLVLGVMCVLSALGYVFFPERPTEGVVYRPDFWWIMGRTVGNLLFYLVSFGMVGAMAEHLLKSKMETREFFSLMCHASMAGFLLLIPQLYPAVAVWWLFIIHEALTKIGKLGTGAVIFLLCIQFVFSMLIGYVYFPFTGV